MGQDVTAPRPASDSEGTILSLMGEMNPPIHHPAWYSHIGVLSDEEQKKALNAQVVVTRQMSIFSTPTFSILCDPEHWQITLPGTDAAALARGVEVIRTVFDEGLKHTPVRAIGVQYHHHLITDSVEVSVSQRIAELVSQLPFGFSCSPGSKGTIALVEPVPGGQVRTIVEGSMLNAASVYTAFTGEYPVSPVPAGYTEFRVDEMIQKRAPELRAYADARIVSILNALRRKI